MSLQTQFLLSLSSVFPAVSFIMGLPVPFGTTTSESIASCPHWGAGGGGRGTCFQEVLSEEWDGFSSRDPRTASVILLA